MIRPAADRKNAFLRCRGHALTMARRIGRLPTPWTVSTPHRPSGISFLSNFYDRQVLFTGIPAFPAAGNRRRVNLRKKTRERTRPCGASSGFSCLCSSRVSCFRRAALGARRYFFEPGMGAINFLSPESLPQVPHTSGFTPGELLHRNGLCIRKLFIPARLPAAVRSREKWMQENGSWKRAKSCCWRAIFGSARFHSAESALLFPDPTRGSSKGHPSPVPTPPCSALKCSALNTASVYHAEKYLYTCACRKSGYRLISKKRGVDERHAVQA